MAYQLSTLVDKIKRRLKDGAFDDNDIIDYINDTQNEVLGADEFSFLEKIHSETLSVGATDFTLPSDYQVSIRLETIDPVNANNASTLDYVPYRNLFNKQPNALTSTAQVWPQYYTLFSNRLIFDTKVDKAYTAKLYYLGRPTELSGDSDVPTIPQEFSEIYVLGALERAEKTRDNYDFAAVHENKRLELVENLRLRYGARQIGTPGQIVLSNVNATL